MAKNAPKISVIIPVFGRPESLSAAVASAVAGLDDGDEVIVVDDGSDPPVALDPHPQLRIERSAVNRGAAAARNLGVAAARNPLIAFLDSDDAWLPGKLSAQRVLFADPPDPLLAVSCGWRETRDDTPLRTRIPRPSRQIADFFAGTWFAPGTTLLLARAAFARFGPFTEGLPRLEDYEWLLRFALGGGRLEVVPDVLATIAAGRHARLVSIEAAVRQIRDDYRGNPRVTGRLRRAMEGWFELASAEAARNEGRRTQMLGALVRSFLLWPRTRVQLMDWWTTPPRA